MRVQLPPYECIRLHAVTLASYSTDCCLLHEICSSICPDQSPHFFVRYAWNTHRWSSSRRLSHGTLCVLWSQPGGPQGEPVLLLATVADRNPRDLCQDRPVLSLRCVQYHCVYCSFLLLFLQRKQLNRASAGCGGQGTCGCLSAHPATSSQTLCKLSFDLLLVLLFLLLSLLFIFLFLLLFISYLSSEGVMSHDVC
jgi:hypothetical protein